MVQALTTPAAPGRPDEQPVVDPPRGRHAVPADRRSWIAPVVVLVVAAVARLWAIGAPSTLIFDETYYVKDAWTLWHLGYEGAWPTNPDAAFDAGHPNGYLTAQGAEFAAHPPLGKWIIGIGEILSGGSNSAGWRIMTAVVGVLAVALLMLVAHRLLGNRVVTLVAGGLMAIDNQAILMSRISLLANMVMLFALAGFACLIEDRAFTERRVDLWLLRRGGEPGGWGPTLLWRPWLLGMGVCLGLCSAVKWSGVYFLAVFAVYSVATDMMLRRRAGIRFWYSASILKQSWATALLTVPIALVVYLASFTSFLLTKGGYGVLRVEDGAQRFTGALAWVPAPLQDLWQWHVQIYAFHIGLDKPHQYEAPAILWPLIARPTSMYWDQPSMSGGHGCAFGSCAAAITDIPNPLIWYAGVAATLYLIYRFARYHEWQAGAILLGWVGGYLPWLLYPKRTIFFFYSIAFEPYLVLALAATIGLLLVRPAAPDPEDEIRVAEVERGVRIRRRLVLGFLVAAVVVSAFFYPLDTGMQTPYWFWHIHMWSPTWV